VDSPKVRKQAAIIQGPRKGFELVLSGISQVPTRKRTVYTIPGSFGTSRC
jgi:hypothetical protein